MCEIFCFNSEKPQEINNCLECFYKHSEEHPDGWGLANMQSDKFVINKEPVKASCSQNLKNILSNPLISKNVFAHIRLATVGEIISPNCHPFIEADNYNRTWMLIHNGTIFDYPELEKFQQKEKGYTDSERILLYIIEKVNEFEAKKQAPSTIKERFKILNEIMVDMSKNNKLNVMIFDGDLTYIHSNLRNSLYYLKKNDSFLVSSTPLNDDKDWKTVELNKLFALSDGNIVFESEEHENEYIPTKEDEENIEKFKKTIHKVDYDD